MEGVTNFSPFLFFSQEFGANPVAGYVEDERDPIVKKIERKSDWPRMQHGTAVASLAVGNTLGVAPKARWKMCDNGGSGKYAMQSLTAPRR